ncbi:type IV conjugative transfer system protein TraL [Rugamonas aquatica]|uniref:Type IV conjugative transfer system protein TraL n=1 Tax=Rugamonas aquatica TaxID=2743357 RepID=A0A6A7N6I3_9BURK|nr:type IV conjugative transfer system protein TraL [Rugamonas aquatica]MQA40599.1 type IV conjugative transfer system protein TraL [Rugamonas aquatica]
MSADGYTPGRLDDQWKLGFWDIDVALPVLIGIFLGWLSGSKTGFCCLLGGSMLVSRWLARKKGDKHSAFILHWLFWNLPPTPMTYLTCSPPSALRRMVG